MRVHPATGNGAKCQLAVCRRRSEGCRSVDLQYGGWIAMPPPRTGAGEVQPMGSRGVNDACRDRVSPFTLPSSTTGVRSPFLGWGRDAREFGVIDLPPPPAEELWRKSSASGANGCVEVARTGEHAWVRDTKNRPGSVLRFTSREWAAFVLGVKQGEFDVREPTG